MSPVKPGRFTLHLRQDRPQLPVVHLHPVIQIKLNPLLRQRPNHIPLPRRKLFQRLSDLVDPLLRLRLLALTAPAAGQDVLRAHPLGLQLLLVRPQVAARNRLTVSRLYRCR